MQLNMSVPASMKRVWQCLGIMIIGFIISDILRDVGLPSSYIFLGAASLALLYERGVVGISYILASIINVITLSLMNISILLGFSEVWRYGFFGLSLIALMAALYYAIVTEPEEG